MLESGRRYDIDWLRVIAIGLLLIYHEAIGFQAWGFMFGFIASGKSWEALWIPMTMLNVWRIPLLFFVSGMGVFFAIHYRNWKQLFLERTQRILVPFVFGIFVVVPIHMYLWQLYYQQKPSYIPNPAHLWFLGNIFVYVLCLSPVFFYLKNNGDGKMVMGLKKVFRHPFGLVLVMLVFILEVVLVNPNVYELYAMTWHGFFLGLFAFFFGFCFVLSGVPFWNRLAKGCWLFVGVAVLLYLYRLLQLPMKVNNSQLAIESIFWIFALFGFGYKHLNHPSKALHYLSQAAYPVYILHMVFLFLGSMLVFPLEISVQLKFILVWLLTVSGCFLLYECVIRRVNFLRFLFGLKPTSSTF
jgi:peptidoglycan/LPS O-acetylase OafA/YrhL